MEMIQKCVFVIWFSIKYLTFSLSLIALACTDCEVAERSLCLFVVDCPSDFQFMTIFLMFFLGCVIFAWLVLCLTRFVHGMPGSGICLGFC